MQARAMFSGVSGIVSGRTSLAGRPLGRLLFAGFCFSFIICSACSMISAVIFKEFLPDERPTT